MSFSDIKIYRDLPVINGYVQIPPNTESNKTRVTRDSAASLITNASIIRLTNGSGQHNGKYGQQELVRLPGIAPNEWYTTDPITELS